MTLLVTLSQKMEKGQEKNSLNEINNLMEFCSKFKWTLKSPKVNFKICQSNIEFVWDIYKIGAM